MSIPFSTQFEKKKKPIRTMPTRKIRLDKLDPSQVTFDEEKIENIAGKDPDDFDVVPVVGKLNGRFTVLDGHHRCAGAMVRGDKYIKARIAK